MMNTSCLRSLWISTFLIYDPETPSNKFQLHLILPFLLFFRVREMRNTFTTTHKLAHTHTNPQPRIPSLTNPYTEIAWKCFKSCVNHHGSYFTYIYCYSLHLCVRNVWFFTCGLTETHAMCRDTSMIHT